MKALRGQDNIINKQKFTLSHVEYEDIMMKELSSLDPVKNIILRIFLFLCVLKEICCLTCYQCSWSDSAVDFKEYMKDKKQKDLKYPIIEPFIGDRIDHPPNKEELDKHCEKVSCKHDSQVCLTWSFVSDTPKNVTYMCVGNPNRRKGCFQQEIKADDVKQYLKVKACLCDDNLCNKTPTIIYSWSMLLLLQTLLLVYFKVCCR